jgi:arylsulfatase A-like enzyme
MTLEKTITPKDVKLVRPPQLDAEQAAVWDAYYEPRNEAYRKANPQGKDLVRWRYQRYMHDYLATVKSVDDNVGRVLKFLEDEGLAENTIVIYSSDQGFYLGEHGWFDKRWIFEESVRTPLLVRWPGVTKPGSVSKALVSNVDYAQTFLDMAGLPSPAEMQGAASSPARGGDARRLAQGVLLSLLRVSAAAPRRAALRHHHRPLQGRAILRQRRDQDRPLRQREGSPRAEELLRSAGL